METKSRPSKAYSAAAIVYASTHTISRQFLDKSNDNPFINKTITHHNESFFISHCVAIVAITGIRSKPSRLVTIFHVCRNRIVKCEILSLNDTFKCLISSIFSFDYYDDELDSRCHQATRLVSSRDP